MTVFSRWRPPRVFFDKVSMVKSKMHKRSPMWSAIAVALLCMFVNWSEKLQGSGPKGD